MNYASFYRLAADAILVGHTLIVVFVVFGFALILLGMARHWLWVRNFWFRIIHLATIGIVVAQAWLGAICPLTLWESQLREAAGDVAYSGSFIEHWLQRLIYYRFPSWVFTVTYTVFAAVVVAAWILAPPRPPRRTGRPERHAGDNSPRGSS
jgi:hypothetical protein